FDKDGLFRDYQTTVHVANVPPKVAIANVPAQAGEGAAITLDADVTDPGTPGTFTYHWHVVASNGQTMADGTQASFTFTPEDNGSYTVSLQVSDGQDTGSASTTIVVLNARPVVVAVETATPVVNEGEIVSFSATVSDAGVHDNLTYLWHV